MTPTHPPVSLGDVPVVLPSWHLCIPHSLPSLIWGEGGGVGHRVHRDCYISHFLEEKPKARRGGMAHTGSDESPVASALQEPGVLGSPAPQLWW